MKIFVEFVGCGGRVVTPPASLQLSTLDQPLAPKLQTSQIILQYHSISFNILQSSSIPSICFNILQYSPISFNILSILSKSHNLIPYPSMYPTIHAGLASGTLLLRSSKPLKLFANIPGQITHFLHNNKNIQLIRYTSDSL